MRPSCWAVQASASMCIISVCDADIKAANKPRHNESLNRGLQNFLYGALEDPHEAAAKKSLAVLIELWQRQVWRDARTVNVIGKTHSYILQITSVFVVHCSINVLYTQIVASFSWHAKVHIGPPIPLTASNPLGQSTHVDFCSTWTKASPIPSSRKGLIDITNTSRLAKLVPSKLLPMMYASVTHAEC